MGSLLTRLLGYLPFNGIKTKLGVLAGLFSVIYNSISAQDLQTLIGLLSQSKISYGALALFLLGILHKWLKATYPEAAAQTPATWGN
jgi:hypothetical protein